MSSLPSCWSCSAQTWQLVIDKMLKLDSWWLIKVQVLGRILAGVMSCVHTVCFKEHNTGVCVCMPHCCWCSWEPLTMNVIIPVVTWVWSDISHTVCVNGTSNCPLCIVCLWNSNYMQIIFIVWDMKGPGAAGGSMLCSGLVGWREICQPHPNPLCFLSLT